MTRLPTASGHARAVPVARRASASTAVDRCGSETLEQHTPPNSECSAGALCFCRRGIWSFDGRARQLLVLHVLSDHLRV